MENIKITLKQNWTVLGKIILNPEALFLMLIVIGLIMLSYFSLEGQQAIIAVILALILAVLSGMLGGFIMKKWMDMKNEEALRSRGYHIIRNLNMLIAYAFSMKKRVITYINRLKREEFNYDLIRSHFEEVAERCDNMFKDLINAIESWQDVIPEANLKQQIATVHSLQREISERVEDLRDLRKLSDKMDKDMSESDRGKLRLSIERIEVTLLELENRFKNEENKVLIDKQFYVYEEGKLFFSDFNRADKGWEQGEEKPKNFKNGSARLNPERESLEISQVH
ncbi:MAG: hypothetical protein HC880_19550 [Bacteroidia bacterium]|nr:hypothetical protein [Bacteroidia bacterium]